MCFFVASYPVPSRWYSFFPLSLPEQWVVGWTELGQLGSWLFFCFLSSLDSFFYLESFRFFFCFFPSVPRFSCFVILILNSANVRKRGPPGLFLSVLDLDPTHPCSLLPSCPSAVALAFVFLFGGFSAGRPASWCASTVHRRKGAKRCVRVREGDCVRFLS